MTRVAIISASTRPNRSGPLVSEWALRTAKMVGPAHAEFELVDLADYDLPLLDEPLPAAYGHYTHEHTRSWAATIGAYDGFVFVTPEYNAGVPAALKNAIDYLAAEWGHKAAGYVGYGTNGGTRAIEQLRQNTADLQLVGVSTRVLLSIFTDFDHSQTDPEDPTALAEFRPAERHVSDLESLLHEVVAWTEALAPLRRLAAGAHA